MNQKRNKICITCSFSACCVVVLSAVLHTRSISSPGQLKLQRTELELFKRREYNETSEFDYFRTLTKSCGKLCQLEEGTFSSSMFFDHRVVPVDCQTIFGDDVFIQQAHGRAEAPDIIPAELVEAYTMNQRVPMSSIYSNEVYLSKQAQTSVWSKQLVEESIANAASGKLKGNYGTTETNHLRQALRHAPGLVGGRVLVIGSENPWVEACVLEAGASSVVTLEYGKIRSEHPKIKTLIPLEFQRDFFNGQLGLFDSIVTFSSVEHSGLGRYGDALNPWGDVLEIARANCVCKPEGSLVLAVMCGNVLCTQDSLEFNLHREYGYTRWPYLASNWHQIYREQNGKQRCHVFQKNTTVESLINNNE
jgi:hypothetical protein